MKKARKVFGRREANVDGVIVRIEMREDGLHIWRKRSQKRKHITFDEVWSIALGQGLLRLQ